MKKFFTVILSIVMFFSIFIFSVLLSCRSIFSKDGINKMLVIGIDGVDMDDYIDDIFASSMELRKYVNEEKMKEAFGNYVADYFKYIVLDEDNRPSAEEIKKIIRDAIYEYEKENGIFLDKSKVENELDSFEDSIEDISIDDEVKVPLQIIYGNSCFVVLGVSIAFLIIIFLINKSIKSVCTSLGIVTIFNGIIIWLISVGLKQLMESDTSLDDLANLFSSPFKKVALFSLIIGITLFIIKIFIGKYKREELV